MNPRRRGAAAVEFLTVAGVLLSLSTGIVDFGWYFSQRARVAVGIAEGAKAAASLLESPGTTYGVEIQAAADTETRRALVDAGVPCDTNCVLTTALVDVDGLSMLRVRAIVAYSPLIGFTPVPSHLAGEFWIAPRDQGDDVGAEPET